MSLSLSSLHPSLFSLHPSPFCGAGGASFPSELTGILTSQSVISTSVRVDPGSEITSGHRGAESLMKSSRSSKSVTTHAKHSASSVYLKTGRVSVEASD